MTKEEAKQRACASLETLNELPEFKKKSAKLALDCIAACYINLDKPKNEKEKEDYKLMKFFSDELEDFIKKLNN